MTVDTQWDATYKNESALYLKKQTFAGADNSDAFFFPVGITNISAYNSDEDNLTMCTTISSQADIEDDKGSNEPGIK